MPKLSDPTNRSLEIALETARLAERRSMDAEAIAAFEEVRSLDPNYPGVAHALAVLYDRSAMTDAAQREYTAALAEDPTNSNVLCDYGYFLYSTGRLDEAEATLRRVLTEHSNHRQSIVNLAVVLATKHEYDEARVLFEQAIGPAAAMHNIGMFKIRQGEVIEGETMIANAFEKDPSIRQAQAVLEHVANGTEGRFSSASVGGQQR
ncbi:MAG: tetratricopeptide repeat protein [Planctomycetota bacterium]